MLLFGGYSFSPLFPSKFSLYFLFFLLSFLSFTFTPPTVFTTSLLSSSFLTVDQLFSLLTTYLQPPAISLHHLLLIFCFIRFSSLPYLFIYFCLFFLSFLLSYFFSSSLSLHNPEDYNFHSTVSCYKHQ